MARARAIGDLRADQSYSDAAARAIEVRAAELAEQSGGVLDVADIERVHDLRVASRRLRAALEAFEPCFPAPLWRATLRDVRELADGLGERRDRDVAITALERFAAGMPVADRAGVASLVGQLRREQADANEALAPLVSEDRLAGLGDRLRELVTEARQSLASAE
jgi:CHAD domain-containing protein